MSYGIVVGGSFYARVFATEEEAREAAMAILKHDRNRLSAQVVPVAEGLIGPSGPALWFACRPYRGGPVKWYSPRPDPGLED